MARSSGTHSPPHPSKGFLQKISSKISEKTIELNLIVPLVHLRVQFDFRKIPDSPRIFLGADGIKGREVEEGEEGKAEKKNREGSEGEVDGISVALAAAYSSQNWLAL